MKLGSAAVLLMTVALAAGERQRFCYKRVGYTRKHAERTSQQYPQGTVSEGACHGAGCHHTTLYKTEVVFRTERHCCAGYQRAGHSVDACLPICSRGCPQGEECTAPNRCECLEGHHRDAAGRCVPVAGDEPRTLPARILSYVTSLLEGVQRLAQQGSDPESSHAAELTSFAHEGTLTKRPAWVELSGARNSTELRRNSTGPLRLSCEPRPLLVPLALGGHSIATQ